MDDASLTQDERVAVARLHALLELLPTALDQHLAPAGLTSFEFTLLEALMGAEPHRLRMSALAARTNATLPRLSRVVTSLERKGLVERAPCLEDGRATNAQLTAAGEAAYEASRPLYATAVRTMVLDGLDADGVTQLADLSYSILTKLDPDARLKVTEAGRECAADPSLASSEELAAACAADPTAVDAQVMEMEPSRAS
jgi:DNA-binding MarR family transcriptional regulator